jgi:predicted RNase H-like HicB family nuclease
MNKNTARARKPKLAPMRLTAAVTHEPPLYVARCLEVEVTSQGNSVEEALANLKEALDLYFENEPLPDGLEPPLIASVELSA